MNDFPDIIDTQVIANEWDIFWETNKLPDPTDVLILCQPYGPASAEEAQLHKMLQACQLDLRQCHILHMNNTDKLAWHRLRDAAKPKAVLLLGVHPQQLGISALFHMFAPNKFDERIWIAAPSLNELEQQQEAKKQLWLNGLKPVFVDNNTGIF